MKQLDASAAGGHHNCALVVNPVRAAIWVVEAHGLLDFPSRRGHWLIKEDHHGTSSSSSPRVLVSGTLAATTVGRVQADSSSLGTRSLAKDGSGFDHTWHDYDIVDNAVEAMLAAKPGSTVGVCCRTRS